MLARMFLIDGYGRQDGMRSKLALISQRCTKRSTAEIIAGMLTVSTYAERLGSAQFVEPVLSLNIVCDMLLGVIAQQGEVERALLRQAARYLGRGIL